jgi:hypothetical protein
MSRGASQFGHVRGQSPDVAGLGRCGFVAVSARCAASAGRGWFGEVGGQSPDVAGRDA